MLAGVLVGLAALAWPASAQYNRIPDSEIDQTIFQIDEKKYLGAKVDGGLALIDETGREFALGDMLGQPLILVLAYYTCDGSCSVINADLRDLMAEAGGMTPGRDFRILTLSFDRYDTIETTGAFARHLELSGGTEKGWTFATFKDPADIEGLAGGLGFKFFWSPRDRTFFHPGVFLFLSPEGRLIRVLYALNSRPRDVELAVLDAKQGQFRPGEIIDFAVSLCYSYNYKEGRYTYNIPLFVAIGSLTLGVTAFSVSALVFRRRRKKEDLVS